MRAILRHNEVQQKADRKAIESRRSFAERVSRSQGQRPVLEMRYTPEEFQAFCDQWTRDVYGERRHASLGMSPAEAAAQAEGTIRRITDERALDILDVQPASPQKPTQPKPVSGSMFTQEELEKLFGKFYFE